MIGKGNMSVGPNIPIPDRYGRVLPAIVALTFLVLLWIAAGCDRTSVGRSVAPASGGTGEVMHIVPMGSRRGQKSAEDSTRPARVKENKLLPNRQRSKAEAEWGIEITSIRLTSANYMIDFRFRVLDPPKAAALLVRGTKPYLIDEASGSKFLVPTTPKVGALRQTTSSPEVDRIYYTFFANPGKFIKPGNQVSVVIGDFKAENLIVQ